MRGLILFVVSFHESGTVFIDNMKDWSQNETGKDEK